MGEVAETTEIPTNKDKLSSRLEKSLGNIDNILHLLSAKEIADIQELMDSDVGHYGPLLRELNVLGECEAKYHQIDQYREILNVFNGIETDALDMLSPPKGQEGRFVVSGKGGTTPYNFDSENHVVQFDLISAKSEEACFRCIGRIYAIIEKFSREGKRPLIRVQNIDGPPLNTDVGIKFVNALSGIGTDGKRPQDFYPERYEEIAQKALLMKRKYDLATLKQKASEFE